MIVYKYLRPDRIDVLENEEIRFTQPALLNDPFESMPNISSYKELQMEKAIREFEELTGESASPALIQNLVARAGIDDIMRTFSMNFGVLSLVKTKRNLLMWAHYTDSHQGFCVGFDSENLFFKYGKGYSIYGLREVIYKKERQIIPKMELSSLFEEEGVEKTYNYFFNTKSKDWDYEEEIRLVALLKYADRKLPGENGNDICLFKFPRECVKEVIFGYNSHHYRRQAIADLVATKYPHVGLFEAVLSETNFDFDIVPYVPHQAANTLD